MKKTNILNISLIFAFFLSSISTYAVTETADNSTTAATIQTWANRANVDKIVLLAKTYNFSKPLIIKKGKNNLTIEGKGKNSTILKLTGSKKFFIVAQGNNVRMKNLTLDGGNKSSSFGAAIFIFSKSTGHQFTNVHFKNSLQDGINSTIGYPCSGLRVTTCEFTNIKKVCVNIFNRNTEKRNDMLITSMGKFIVDRCTFNAGYERGVIIDCGNDRQKLGSTNNGPRYRQTTNLNGSEIKGCIFKQSKKFHIGGVQAENFNIWNNRFDGMNNAATTGECVHLEQFSKNIEIFKNKFFMTNTSSKKFNYIGIGGTEGHKRVSGNGNTNPAAWRFKVTGGNERRASTNCAKDGDTNANCKRDDHTYGSRRIYIAKNTFNSSNKVAKYVKMIEGEDNHIGYRRNGSASTNTFNGGTVKKISLGGNHRGTCGVRIASGQGIAANNVDQLAVHFSATKCRTSKRNKIGSTNLPAEANTSLRTLDFDGAENNSLLSISPNPATNIIQLSTSAASYTVSISDLSGNAVKTINGNQNNITVDVSSLTQGLYIMVLTSDSGETKVEKLVIN